MNTSMRTLALVALLCGSNAYACITSESENNNSESRADGPVCSGDIIAGSIGSRRDVDWFSLTVPASGTIDISLDHSGSDDFDWDLYTTSGPAVASGATSSVPETGSYSGPAGDYFVKVSRYSGTGWYDLQIDFPTSGGGGGTACNEYGPRPSKPGNLQAWTVGQSQDVCPVTASQGAVLLMGGGPDVDASFSQRVSPHINGGDVVVIRTSGTDAYNDYLLPLTGADSVETLILNTRSKADSDYADWVIRSAEFVFIAGGDQSDYLNQWLGTKVQSALQHVYQKNGVIGGTSAGNAVQGEYIYDPDGVLGAISEEVVTDFCHETINISSGFLTTPVLANVITDTHFAERDRMGRMAVFLSHIGIGKMAIGVSEDSALFVTEDGNGLVDGSGNVYILTTDSQTRFTQTSCGNPVIIEDLLNYRLTPGDSFNVLTGATSINPTRLDIDGRDNNFYNPNNPY
ncbi:MAG: Type 1 glutamine amidotransferase-like domain-containing protein [Aestuariibacter sp.]